MIIYPLRHCRRFDAVGRKQRFLSEMKPPALSFKSGNFIERLVHHSYAGESRIAFQMMRL
jgi:hypothetical protein